MQGISAQKIHAGYDTAAVVLVIEVQLVLLSLRWPTLYMLVFHI